MLEVKNYAWQNSSLLQQYARNAYCRHHTLPLICARDHWSADRGFLAIDLKMTRSIRQCFQTQKQNTIFASNSDAELRAILSTLSQSGARRFESEKLSKANSFPAARILHIEDRPYDRTVIRPIRMKLYFKRTLGT